MFVTFDHIEHHTPKIKTFWFKPDKPVRYIAGQFTELRLPHDHTDERGDKRWFTLSSSPTDSLISITTAIDSKHGSSFKRTLMKLMPGTRLKLAEPMGDFVLPKDASVPLLFAADGMGVTPVHSMIKWLHDTKQQRNIQLIYGVESPAELVFHELFDQYDLQFSPLVQHATRDWTGKVGILTTDLILNFAHKNPHGLIYLSGPELMIEAFVTELKAAGIPNRRLVTDYFPGYPGKKIIQ